MCFELYGFDVLLDANLKAWLLEVNVCPSLSSSSPLDKRIKTMLLIDTLHLIGVQPFDRKKLDKDADTHNKKRLLGLSKCKCEGDRLAPKPLHKNISEVKNLTEFSEETLTEEDINMLLDSEEEQQR